MKPNTTSQSNPSSIACQISLTELRSPPRSLITWRLPHSLLAMGLALCSAMTAPAQTYSVTRVIPPSGVAYPAANGLNNLGHVVGETWYKGGRSPVAGPAYVWANGLSVTLPSLGSYPTAGANAISDTGIIVGVSPSKATVYDPTRPFRAVWWQKVGTGYVVGNWNDLLPAGTPLFLEIALAITEDGKFVLFYAKHTDGRSLAVVAQVGVLGQVLTVWPIDTFGDGGLALLGSSAHNIHSDGSTLRVVGGCRTEANTGHQFLWQRNVDSGAVTMVDLDPGDRTSYLNDVNGLGEAVGIADVGNGVFQAFFWSAPGVAQQLPTLGGPRSGGVTINTAGNVVGWSYRSGNNAVSHGFVWNSDTGIMRDLNSVLAGPGSTGIEIRDAFRINNVGQILVWAEEKPKNDVTLVLTPQ